MKKKDHSITVTIIILLFVVFSFFTCQAHPSEMLNQMPEYVPENDIPNHEWCNEERIDILDYRGHAMEIGISPDGSFLLFNDGKKPDKDMHWSERIDDRTYQYQGKVRHTVSDRVDGTPCFDGNGNIYFTTLKRYPQSLQTIFKSRFRDGVALNPLPIMGNIYIEGRNQPSKFWVSLDPDISDDGRLLFYSEGRFDPSIGVPYPFNLRGAVERNGEFVRLDDRLLENINTDSLEYAPAISSDGLEIFFSRIGKVNGRLKMVGIFTARRNSVHAPFAGPERIVAITGDVEAPVLSGDENRLYYHRMDRGVFRAYRVTRKGKM